MQSSITNAVPKLGVGSRHGLKRWFRVPRDSALEQEKPMHSTVQLGPVAQIACTARDIKESEAWYREARAQAPLHLWHARFLRLRRHTPDAERAAAA